MCDTAAPVLYSFRRCPYAMRARSALLAAGLSCELREVRLPRKPAAMLQASPKGTVPVLVLPGGQVIEQSLEIMLWALRVSDPLGWLQPGHGTLDDLLALIAACDHGFKPDLDRYKYPGRFAGTDPLRHRDAGAVFLRTLELRLQQAAQLAGERPSLADAAIAPFVRQFAMTDPAWFAAQPWPRLRRWLDDWTGSDAFDRVMRKHLPWDEEAPVVTRWPADVDQNPVRDGSDGRPDPVGYAAVGGATMVPRQAGEPQLQG